MLFKMTEPEVKPISPPRSELTLLCRDARGSPFRLGLGDEIWQGHILVTGGTGTGKTTVIRQLLARCRDVYPDASFLVLDVKGDYVPYRRPGDKVFSFYGGEDAFRWNILEEARRRHTRRRMSWTRWSPSCFPAGSIRRGKIVSSCRQQVRCSMAICLSLCANAARAVRPRRTPRWQSG